MRGGREGGREGREGGREGVREEGRDNKDAREMLEPSVCSGQLGRHEVMNCKQTHTP